MKCVEYLTIGELANTCSVSVDRLRNYDRIGLLEPVYRDEASKRRYYSIKQVFYLSVIDELRKLDFSLKDIKKIFSENNIEKITDIYSKNRDMIDKKLGELIRIRESIEKRLDNFEDINLQNQKVNFEKINIKEHNDRHYIAMKFSSKIDENAFILAHQKISKYIQKNKIRVYPPCTVAFHGEYSTCTTKKTDFELCKPSDKNHANDKYFKTIDKGIYATIFFKGGLLASIKHYSLLMNWIDDNGYKTKGPLIKKYITDGFHLKNPDEFFGEFQIMIYK
jgi:DNA-binding transcriptional MerR regulator